MIIGTFNLTSEDLDTELKELKELLEKVITDFKIGDGEFNVIIVDNNHIKEINKEYRNMDKPTDVISFALEDDKTYFRKDYRLLGDIYISIDKVHEQAKSYNHSKKRELSFLAVHGLLHLLGYDHMTNEDEQEMFLLQDQILEKYKIGR